MNYVDLEVIHNSNEHFSYIILEWIIMGSDRRPETKQGEIVRFRSGTVSDRVSYRDSDRRLTRLPI